MAENGQLDASKVVVGDPELLKKKIAAIGMSGPRKLQVLNLCHCGFEI